MQRLLSLILLLCFGVGLGFDVNAQSSDRYSIYYEQLGASNGVSATSFYARAGQRMLLDEEGSSLLTFGVNYSQLELTDKSLFSPDRFRQLQTVVPEFSLMQILNEKYSLVATARPGFFGDLRGGMGNDFRFEGAFVVTRFMTDNLTLGAGIGRGTNFGRDLVVPLVQFLYFASDKILIRGVLPVQASVWYIPNQEWELGALYRISGSLYQIEDTSIPDAEKLGFGTIHAGVSAKRKIQENSFAVVEMGMTATRRYEWTNETSPAFITQDEPANTVDLDAVPYIRIGWQQRL